MSEFNFLYSKNQVNEAGLYLRDHADYLSKEVEVDNALDVLGAWRASHVYPLQVAYMLLRERTRSLDREATVSQRLKRTPSILLKLHRHHSMKLSTVQDIGGCRAVVKDVQTAKKLAARYTSVARDYLATPKEDGYRSIHMIEHYTPKDPKYSAYTGRRTEVQIRTKLQHAWATAVETIDSLLGERLKTGGGQEEWRRFFALASGYIAIREGCPGVPQTPQESSVMEAELRSIADKLRVAERLNGLASTVTLMEQVPNPKGFRPVAYIIVLDLNTKKLIFHPYNQASIEQAAEDYLDLEKQHYGDESIQIVQVAVNKVKNLRRAYPSYYLNAQNFLSTLNEVLR